MCRMKKLVNGNSVADIKYDCIMNIIEQAEKCKGINKIVLFGSSIEERCTDDSDIDIAVFGNTAKTKYLKSKEFKDFHKNLFSFKNDFSQDYDILYFYENQNHSDAIMTDINNGIEIYRRSMS